MLQHTKRFQQEEYRPKETLFLSSLKSGRCMDFARLPNDQAQKLEFAYGQILLSKTKKFVEKESRAIKSHMHRDVGPHAVLDPGITQTEADH